MLNRRTLSDGFGVVPEVLFDAKDLFSTSIVLDSITIEWDNFVSVMRNCISRKPKAQLSNMK